MAWATKLTIVAIPLVLLVLVACGPGGNGVAPSPTLPSDPLKQMEIAFEGNPSPREIQPLLDRALEVTDTPLNADSYSRAGSVLVSLSNEFGATEMEILRCMPGRSRDSRIAPEYTFDRVAAVCSTDIIQGDYP